MTVFQTNFLDPNYALAANDIRGYGQRVNGDSDEGPRLHKNMES